MEYMREQRRFRVIGRYEKHRVVTGALSIATTIRLPQLEKVGSCSKYRADASTDNDIKTVAECDCQVDFRLRCNLLCVHIVDEPIPQATHHHATQN